MERQHKNATSLINAERLHISDIKALFQKQSASRKSQEVTLEVLQQLVASR
jgi:hypothetical protein